jgi:uncharacterized alkaline shock family protein YloU
MVKLRKFLAVVYLISVVLGTGALALYWYGVEPVASFMGRTRADPWMFYIVLALLGICAVGALGYVACTLSQRGRNTFQKTSTELGTVQISRTAIMREVNDVLDAHDEFKRQKTIVKLRGHRRPYARVEVRVAPQGSYSMPDLAGTLQREIKEAVEHLTGNEVRSVDVDVRKQSGSGDEYVAPALAEGGEIGGSVDAVLAGGDEDNAKANPGEDGALVAEHDELAAAASTTDAEE